MDINIYKNKGFFKSLVSSSALYSPYLFSIFGLNSKSACPPIKPE